MSSPRELPPWQRPIVRIVQSRPGSWWFVNVSRRIDPILLRLTAGRLSSVPGAPVLLLQMTGGRSGKRRTLPLLYGVDGHNLLLVASKGGAPSHPAWYHNLRAHPRVSVLAAGRSGEYVAHEAEGSERKRGWRIMNRIYPGYERYQERAGGRRIPVMVLERAAAVSQ